MLRIVALRLPIEGLLLEIPELSIEDGELFVLLGPSGAGKSSLLQVLAGFGRVREGRIFLQGEEITDWPPERRRTALIFQEPYLFPHLDVRQNIQFADGNTPRFQEVVQMLKLGPHLEKAVGVLSGGERQLVAIARALMARPRLLLLDEAFSAIDPQHRKKVLQDFRDLQQELGMTTLAVTHNFEEALYLGSRLGIIMHGRLVQAGRPEEVFLNPVTPEVALFLGAENLYFGHFEPSGTETAEGACERAARFRTSGPTLWVLTDRFGPGYALVHPQDITLSVATPNPSSALNRLKGRILSITRSGGVFRVHVDAGLAFHVFVTPQSCRDLGLTEGKEVYLTFKAASVKTY